MKTKKEEFCTRNRGFNPYNLNHVAKKFPLTDPIEDTVTISYGNYEPATIVHLQRKKKKHCECSECKERMKHLKISI